MVSFMSITLMFTCPILMVCSIRDFFRMMTHLISMSTLTSNKMAKSTMKTNICWKTIETSRHVEGLVAQVSCPETM